MLALVELRHHQWQHCKNFEKLRADVIKGDLAEIRDHVLDKMPQQVAEDPQHAEGSQAFGDSQVFGDPQQDDEAASDPPSSDAEPSSKKAKTELERTEGCFWWCGIGAQFDHGLKFVAILISN